MQYSSASLVAAALALFAVQLVPAPQAAVTAATTGSSVLGPMTNSNTKRDDDPLAQILGSVKGLQGSVSSGQVRKRGAPSATDCQSQLKEAKLSFSQPAHTTVHVSGIPPACMSILSVISGKIHNSNPVKTGADSMQFENLSDADLDKIEDLLHVNAK